MWLVKKIGETIIDKRFERRGELQSDIAEEKITDMMVMERMEMQTQKQFLAKKRKLEFQIKFEVQKISELRLDYAMCDDLAEKARIKKK